MCKAYSPFLWLLVTVFFIRALVPAGFMPDVSGRHLLTICSGTGTATILVDQNNQPLSESTSHHPDQAGLVDFCPFSLLSASLLIQPTTQFSFLKPLIVESDGMPAFFLAGILPLSLQNNHLSRAPPAFS